MATVVEAYILCILLEPLRGQDMRLFSLDTKYHVEKRIYYVVCRRSMRHTSFVRGGTATIRRARRMPEGG